jgi:hypothetical protein
MGGDAEVRCHQCSQTLSPGSGYCVSCGFNNSDVESRKFGLEQEAGERIERARIFGKLFRFLRVLRVGR